MWILILIARCKFLGEVRLGVEKGGADGNRARGRKTEEKGDGEEESERERERRGRGKGRDECIVAGINERSN